MALYVTFKLRENPLVPSYNLIEMAFGSGMYVPASVSAEWAASCELEVNRNMPVLNRAEGGLGGHVLQVRLDTFNHNKLSIKFMGAYDNPDEKWSLYPERMVDLIRALKSVIASKVGHGIHSEDVFAVVEAESVFSWLDDQTQKRAVGQV